MLRHSRRRHAAETVGAAARGTTLMVQVLTVRRRRRNGPAAAGDAEIAVSGHGGNKVEGTITIIRLLPVTASGCGWPEWNCPTAGCGPGQCREGDRAGGRYGYD